MVYLINSGFLQYTVRWTVILEVGILNVTLPNLNMTNAVCTYDWLLADHFHATCPLRNTAEYAKGCVGRVPLLRTVMKRRGWTTEQACLYGRLSRIAQHTTESK